MSEKEIEQTTPFKDMAEEQIIELVKKGDSGAQDYIFGKYKGLVKMKARAYFLIGADREDIIQEGMIGLYKATRDFQREKNTSFRVFADLCIGRQIMTAIKASTRQKHIPLNSYVSLNKSAFEEDSDATYMDFIKEVDTLTPESMLIGREDKNFIETGITKVLSAFELKVLAFYLRGRSYYEIANMTGKPEKSIDNALQRVKRKIEKMLEQNKLDF